MKTAQTLLRLLLLVFVHRALGLVSSQSIHWVQCAEEFEGNKTANVTIQCASLTVPLDYTNHTSNETIKLQLLRAPAVKQPSKGSILFNFGGPGQIGRLDLVQRLNEHIPATGYEHDLVIFDPRGTGTTLPSSCYDDTVLSYLDRYSSFTNSSDTALGENWSTNGMIAEMCGLTIKHFGAFLGTSFVARDLMRVVDALGEDGMLRFWGHSYGTTLGATVAAMFPDRVDRMVLDGVLNSHEYFHAYDLEWLTDTDKTWSGFFEGCAAAPHSCPLANGNVTAAELEAEFYNFLYQLKYNPLPTTLGVLVDYAAVKNVVVAAVYDPSTWPRTAALLSSLYKGNGTNFLLSQTGGAASDTTSNANAAIKCADKMVRTKTMEAMMPHVLAKYNISRLVGDVYVPIDFECAQWKMQAKEIYKGTFCAKTKNPILFVSNSHDPMTPLVSAKNMTSGFEGSMLLEQTAYGHGVFAQPSVCAINSIQRYFVHGRVPSSGTVCNSQVDVPLFSGKNVTDVLKKLDIPPPPGYKI